MTLLSNLSSGRLPNLYLRAADLPARAQTVACAKRSILGIARTRTHSQAGSQLGTADSRTVPPHGRRRQEPPFVHPASTRGGHWQRYRTTRRARWRWRLGGTTHVRPPRTRQGDVRTGLRAKSPPCPAAILLTAIALGRGYGQEVRRAKSLLERPVVCGRHASKGARCRDSALPRRRPRPSD